MFRLTFFLTVCLGWSAAAVGNAHAASDLVQARSLLMKGRYDEARQSYAALAKQDSVASAIGQSRCLDAVGQLDRAIAILRSAADAHPGSASLRAERARLEFERGGLDAAQTSADAALALDPDQPAARYIVAELHRVAGRLDQANDAYRWFIRFYNAQQDSIRDPETLRWIGLAAAQFARWNRNAGQFHFLVNDLYPDALKLDSAYWPAHLEAALLFIEKYNLADANAELDRAMETNPASAEVHAARALADLQTFELDSARAEIDRALAINPRLVVAHQLAADARFIALGPREAVPILEQARTLNPVDEETLGRLAAAYGAADGLSNDGAGTRMGGVIAEATRRNEHCGGLYASLGSSLSLLGKHTRAVGYYEEALRRMPQLVTIPGKLGLAYMMAADEARAKEQLTRAFEIDPFNVRVKNTLDVLELLDGYATLETEHFRIRFDRARDSVLVRYAARWLEHDVYAPVVKEFGYAPRTKTLIEIFGRAKGATGHNWFSTRMSGVPFIGPVAASTGMMVGMTSPNDGPSVRFNWARVLKHEFVHVVNLQQTDFNITRWYTEGLAVREEGPDHPDSWDGALARRAASNQLFDLATISRGFLRPVELDDWALAYYQSELYTRYMVERFGPGALNKLIAAYAANLDTGPALQRSFGTSVQAFEKGYRDYVGAIAARLPRPSAPPAKPMDMAALQRAVEEKPRDADLRSRLALEFLKVNLDFRAKEHATAALAIDPKQTRAAMVLATAEARGGDEAKALQVLRGAFDPGSPDPEMLELFATLTLGAHDTTEAQKLLALGREKFPGNPAWNRGLADLYRAAADTTKLAAALAGLADADGNEGAARAELARLAYGRGDDSSAVRWAGEALQVDVLNAGTHATLGRALARSGRAGPGIEEIETAIGLDPRTLEWRMALAQACIAAKQNDRARQVLDDLLSRDLLYPGAQQLRQSLGH
jgi:tetratricopeptide (TPR) repeat protein